MGIGNIGNALQQAPMAGPAAGAMGAPTSIGNMPGMSGPARMPMAPPGPVPPGGGNMFGGGAGPAPAAGSPGNAAQQMAPNAGMSGGLGQLFQHPEVMGHMTSAAGQAAMAHPGAENALRHPVVGHMFDAMLRHPAIREHLDSIRGNGPGPQNR